MPEESTEFTRAIKALVDEFVKVTRRYPKGKVLAELKKISVRPAPKRKDNSEMLIRMGHIVTWHPELSLRAAAEIVTRHLPDTDYRRSVIDRVRKGFAEDKDYYLRTGKINAMAHLLTVGKRAGSANEDRDKPNNGDRMVTLMVPDDEILDKKFQELRSTLRAECVLTDKDPVVVFYPRPGEIWRE